MSNCLCCNKKTKNGDLYHKKCIKRLFGTEKVPVLEFNTSELVPRISENIGKMSISGVQIKASAALDKKKNSIEIVQSGGTHILKPEPGEYPRLPQNENLCMNMAENAGIIVPPHGLFYLADGKLCYIIRRFDRDDKGHKIHVEDMAQLMDLPSDSKYEASLEKVGKTILNFSRRPYLDLIEFFLRTLFCFIIGNGDMHIKNWSLISDRYGNYYISPCYDLICSKIYIPGEDESALTLNGKRNRITDLDFTSLAEYLKIDKKSYSNVFSRLEELKQFLIEMIAGDDHFNMKDKMKEILIERYGALRM
jgi:serine/threonine-protein kinase HipA